MQQENDIFNRVRSIIADQLNSSKDAITSEAQLESLGADSLDRVEIVMKLEEEFGIEINDEEAEKFNTVGQAVDYIKTLVKNKN